MQKLTKAVSRQDANFKLSPSSSNETSINLSKEISALISDESSDVTFKLFKSDFIKAMGALCLIPNVYYKKDTAPTPVGNIFSDLSKQIDAQFGETDISFYTIFHFKREDGRSYFNNLKQANGFNLRAFLIEQFSFLTFEKQDDGTLVLRVETTTPQEELPEELAIAKDEAKSNVDKQPLQVIYFGAPGTGKSHRIKQECKDNEHYRITFHPDTDYASFVGSYKPITHSEQVYTNMGDKAIALKDSVTGEAITTTKITYKYVYQAFLNAYIAAWKEQQNEEPKPVFLVIEEINRGNCAQIFGDIFQLLDRNDAGYSDYPIVTDNDLKKELEAEFADLTVANAYAINALYEEGDVVGKVVDGSRLLLPNNLYIWATMNTSDQSLFPIDSAFKRRWEWKYIKIADSGKNYIISINGNEYDWWSFVNKINDIIGSEIEQEDKKLGYFFAKTSKNADGRYIISADKFLSKVIFFLYNDVFKDFGFEYDFFKDKDGNIMLFADYFNEYGDTDHDKVETFIRNLGLKPLNETSEAEDEDAAEQADIEEAEGKTGDSKLIIKFPDGRTFQGKTQFDSYLMALEAIGLDKCEPIAAKMKYHRHNTPLITMDKSDELLTDNTYSYVQVGDYYVVKGINTRTKRNLLKQISNELNLGIEAIVE